MSDRNDHYRETKVMSTAGDRLAGSKGRRSKVCAATLALVALSPTSLHAEVSEKAMAELQRKNAELAKEVADVKAQIRLLMDSVSPTRPKSRKAGSTLAKAAPEGPPPTLTALPAEATPVYATIDKKLQFGALTITPGGFVEMAGLYRTRNLQSDDDSVYNAIPTNNLSQAHLGETKLTYRQSRAALLVEAPISKSVIAAGYGEFDLNGAGTTSNFGQGVPFVPRVRNLYGQLELNDYGLHVLAGQNWSLIVPNSKGITPRNEVVPPTIDETFLPGFDFARTPQIRLVKDFGKKLWFGLSVEAPQTQGITGNCGNAVSNTGGTIAGVTANPATGVAGGSCYLVGNGYYGGAGTNQQFSINQVPDVVGKVAYEATIGDRDIHIEGLGLYKTLTDYVEYGQLNAVSGYPGAGQHNTTGWGAGASLVAPIIPRKLDVQAVADVGRGLGRYTSSVLPDATVTGDGVLRPLFARSVSAGAIVHMTPAIDLYAFAGLDQLDRLYTFSNNAQQGYGLTGGVDNTGCNAIGGTCAGQTKRVWGIVAGFWDKLYKGSFGEIRVGASYNYVERDLFSATVNANGFATIVNPYMPAKNNDHIIFTSLRYYPFQ